MISRQILLTAAVCIFALPVAARAQQAESSNPRISIVHPAPDRLKADIKNILQLSSKTERKQYTNIQDFIDTFLEGVDTEKPVRVDLVVGQESVRYLWGIAVTNIKEFRNNIQTLGIESKLRGGRYQLSGETEGWMVKTSDGRVIVAETASDIALMKTDTVSGKLVSSGDDLLAEIENTQNSAAAMAARKKSFATVRKEMNAALKQKSNESSVRFAVRKQALENQLQELERLFSDTKRVKAGWKYNADSTGRLNFDLAPIPDSNLAKAVSQFGQNESRFGGILSPGNSVLSVRLNHPLDDLRQNYLSMFFDKSLAALNEYYQSAAISAAEKRDSSAIASGFVKMLKDGAASGILDGFAEATPNGTAYTIVGGVKTPRDMSSDVEKLMNLLPTARKGHTVKMNVGSIGDIKIHSTKLTTSYSEIASEFLGNDRTIHIAVGPDTLWYAAGPGALDALKAAVKQSANAGGNKNQAVALMARLTPGLKLLDMLREKQPAPTTRAARTAAKEKREMREMAIKTFASGNDKIMFQAGRSGDNIVGEMLFDKGLMTFVAKQIAKFSKENLEI